MSTDILIVCLAWVLSLMDWEVLKLRQLSFSKSSFDLHSSDHCFINPHYPQVILMLSCFVLPLSFSQLLAYCSYFTTASFPAEFPLSCPCTLNLISCSPLLCAQWLPSPLTCVPQASVEGLLGCIKEVKHQETYTNKQMNGKTSHVYNYSVEKKVYTSVFTAGVSELYEVALWSEWHVLN